MMPRCQYYIRENDKGDTLYVDGDASVGHSTARALSY